MITSVAGTVESVGPDWVNVSIGGVTVRVSIPSSAVERAGRPGDAIRLYTTLIVRDDGISLYGFLTNEDRQSFDALIGVNGVGPRLALSVLSGLNADTLSRAVAVGDAGPFEGIPGVGKKTAARILIDLKDKLGWEIAVSAGDGAASDVAAALVALGYSTSEAREAVASVGPGDGVSLEESVRLALEHLAGG